MDLCLPSSFHVEKNGSETALGDNHAALPLPAVRPTEQPMPIIRSLPTAISLI